MNDKTIGIIGGMGPDATAKLFKKIIRATKAKRDQDHFRIVIDSNPKVPDRTAAILHQGPSPVDAIVRGGKNLEKIGADIGLIPCNTSHYFFDEIQDQLKLPLVNMIAELGQYIKNTYPKIKTAGLLATTGTVKTRLFDKYIKDIDILTPCDFIQENKVMEAIYGEGGIKSGHIGDKPRNLLKEAADDLIKKGADLIISGCTEIGLVLKADHISVPLLDPMDIAIQVVIDRLS